MTLLEYPGLVPMNVNRDAKYSVVSGPDGYEVRLIYRVSSREQYLLTTNHHSELVEMVNRVKTQVQNQPPEASSTSTNSGTSSSRQATRRTSPATTRRTSSSISAMGGR